MTHFRFNRRSLLATLALSLMGMPAAVPAQTGIPSGDPFADDTVAIAAAHIITVNSGVIENGVILCRGGKIVKLGADVKVPFGVPILRADTVMPGIVGISSQIGLSPAAAGAAPGPGGPGGPGGAGFGGGARAVSNPHLKVIDEIYPFEDTYAKLLREGVTSLALVPGGTGIPGQGTVIRPAGDSPQAMAVAANSVLSVHFAANTQTMDLIRAAFDGVKPQPVDNSGGDPMGDIFGGDGAPRPLAPGQVRRGQGGRPGGFGAGPATNAGGNSAARTEVLLKAFNGDIPTMVACPDNAAVAYALPLFSAYDKLKPIYLLTAADSDRVAGLLGAKSRDVVLPAALMIEPLTTNRVNVAAKFLEAGCKVACRPTADDVEGYHTLRFQMGQLVKAGMDPDFALRAITLSPAEMLNISGRVGSVAVGRDANLILLNAGPFEPGSQVLKVLLEGKVVYNNAD